MKLSKMIAVAFLGMMTLFLANCSKDSGSSTAASQYSYINGQCYDNTNKIYVTTTLCTTNTQYQYQNGQCYDTVNRVYTANTQLCQQSMVGGYGTSTCNAAGIANTQMGQLPQGQCVQYCYQYGRAYGQYGNSCYPSMY